MKEREAEMPVRVVNESIQWMNRINPIDQKFHAGSLSHPGCCQRRINQSTNRNSVNVGGNKFISQNTEIPPIKTPSLIMNTRRTACSPEPFFPIREIRTGWRILRGHSSPYEVLVPIKGSFDWSFVFGKGMYPLSFGSPGWHRDLNHLLREWWTHSRIESEY